MKKPFGKIVHWYDKIGVAVLELKSGLKKGDKVKFQRGDEEFEEVVESMQVDHKDVASAKKGDEVAVKLSQKAKEGTLLFKA